MLFLVKLFPEITIKSRPVRRRFIRNLRRNLKKLLLQVDNKITVTGEWDALEVETSSDRPALKQPVIDILCNTPGIAHTLLVHKSALPDFDTMVELTRSFFGDSLAGKTFAVRCKRSGKHAFKSVDVERYVGGGLNQYTDAKGVNLTNPDITVNLEIKQDQLLLVEKRYKGLGGFPLGSQDGVLSLISGGFDSAVSSYLCIKRGLLTHYCFFNLGGREHEVAVKEVALFLWMKYGASHRVKFISIDFEPVVAQILTRIEDSQMGVILKRMMLRAASKVAEKMQLKALVTGEAVAQVSSQTLANLAVIDSVTDTLVLRPLVTTDKQDIIDLARKIGTEDFSKNIPEYCGVISVKPTTRARIERIEREEANFDFTLLDQSVENAQSQLITHVAGELDRASARVEIVTSPPQGSIVSDVRHPQEEETQPLTLYDDAGQVELMKIPFYQLRTQFQLLNQDKQYLLYCSKGMMSRLHAAHLQDEGFQNVAVYSPKAGNN